MSSDDIVERLRRWDDGGISTHWTGCFDSHPVCAIVFAADAIEARDAEIVRLRAELAAERVGRAWIIINDLTAEVERLRTAGDALAAARHRDLGRSTLDDQLLDAWQESRRG